MRGVLRLLPSEGSNMSPRKIVLRQAPSPSLIEDCISGKLRVVHGFDTVLEEGGPVRCLAFRARTTTDLRSNVLANWLWLQSLIRANPEGFSETRKNEPRTLTGPIAALYGDDAFMKDLIHAFLALDIQRA